MLFSQDWHSAAAEVTLLSTCRLIKKEAYPLFLSSNNFKIDVTTRSLYPPTHAFFKHVREVTFEWMPKWLGNNNTSTRLCGRVNAGIIRDLYKYPKLQILHIRGYWSPLDDDYMHLRRHYREEGVIYIYLERTGLEAFLGIPGVNKITVQDSLDGRKQKI